MKHYIIKTNLKINTFYLVYNKIEGKKKQKKIFFHFENFFIFILK